MSTKKAAPISRVAAKLPSTDPLPYTSYDVTCDGNRMLAGPHLIEGNTGHQARVFQEPTINQTPNKNGHAGGAFKSEIVAMSCSGDRILLSSFNGLHLFQAGKYVRTFNMNNLTNVNQGPGYFYPFGKVTTNCPSTKILATIPTDTSRRSNSVILLDADKGTILTSFPPYDAGQVSSGVALAMNCAGNKIALGYPTGHLDGKGEVRLFDETGHLILNITCPECSIGAHFGATVDFNHEGDKLLVTFRSQEDKKMRQRRTQLGGYNFGGTTSGIREVARIYSLQGEILQSFLYDQRETGDDVNADWRGIISGDGSRVLLSSTFKSPSTFAQEARTMVYDAQSGHIIYASTEDQIVAVDMYISKGIGYGANPSGVYVYSLTAPVPQESSGSSSGSGGTIAAVVAVAMLGVVFITILVIGQRKRRSRHKDSVTEDERQDIVELPSVT